MCSLGLSLILQSFSSLSFTLVYFLSKSLSASILFPVLLPSARMKGKPFLSDGFVCFEWRSKMIRACKNYMAVMFDLPCDALNGKKANILQGLLLL